MSNSILRRNNEITFYFSQPIMSKKNLSWYKTLHLNFQWLGDSMPWYVHWNISVNDSNSKKFWKHDPSWSTAIMMSVNYGYIFRQMLHHVQLQFWIHVTFSQIPEHLRIWRHWGCTKGVCSTSYSSVQVLWPTPVINLFITLNSCWCNIYIASWGLKKKKGFWVDVRLTVIWYVPKDSASCHRNQLPMGQNYPSNWVVIVIPFSLLFHSFTPMLEFVVFPRTNYTHWFGWS